MTASESPANLLRRFAGHWAWLDVLLPLIAIRLALLATGWLARYFPTNADYPDAAVARGWQFSPYRLLDIWGRWDSGWYANIALHGYRVQGNVAEVQSNVAFFPVYPYLVAGLLWLVPDRLQSGGVVLLAGLVVANGFLVAALLLLHRLVMTLYADRPLAQRTVLYLLLFPTGFFLSAFYSEAAFLFFAVAVFYAASQRAWSWGALAAAVLGATRPLGVLIGLPLFWLYLDAAGWRLRAIRWDVLWLLLVPAGFLAHLWHIYAISGNWLAPIYAQQAFFRGATTPWTTLLDPVNPNIFLIQLEQVLTLVFLAGSIIACFRLPSAAYGLYGLMLVVPPLFTGTLTSNIRFYVTVFPVFILLALAGRSPLLDRPLQTLFFAVQIVLMVAWSQFYWVA
jgi:hypothetical protein